MSGHSTSAEQGPHFRVDVLHTGLEIEQSALVKQAETQAPFELQVWAGPQSASLVQPVGAVALCPVIKSACTSPQAVPKNQPSAATASARRVFIAWPPIR